MIHVKRRRRGGSNLCGMFSFMRRAWQHAVRDIAELELWEVLRRRGTRKLANECAPALKFAVERCTECAQPELCARLLAAGQDDKIAAFCPNAMYLRHLDAMRRHAPKRELLGPDT